MGKHFDGRVQIRKYSYGCYGMTRGRRKDYGTAAWTSWASTATLSSMPYS